MPVHDPPARERSIPLAEPTTREALRQILSSSALLHDLELTLVEDEGDVLAVAVPDCHDGSVGSVGSVGSDGSDGCKERIAHAIRSSGWSGSGVVCAATCGCDKGNCQLVRITEKGLPALTMVVGPAVPARDGIRQIAEHLGRVVAALLSAVQGQRAADQANPSELSRAYAALEDRNQRLAEMVERLKEADRLKTSFLSTVSHELRTPLTSVIGYSEMLLEGLAGPLNEEQREYVKTIMEKGDQLLQIIGSLLDVSRLEAGSLRLVNEPIDLWDLLAPIVGSLSQQARRKELLLRLPARINAPPVLGDRKKLRQVVSHLLGNAIKFTPRGGKVEIEVEVGVEVEAEAEASTEAGAAIQKEVGAGGGQPEVGVAAGSGRSGANVCIRVRDTGIGIAKDKQTRIFEPFFQVDSSSTREYGGTGLGLTLVKSVVEAHGGRVWVESDQGCGSCFTISLPLAMDSRRQVLAMDGEQTEKGRVGIAGGDESVGGAASPGHAPRGLP
ncbi:MAG: HAMP domain-containing sensor histidine kinase [Pseudomonadota bacterium]